MGAGASVDNDTRVMVEENDYEAVLFTNRKLRHELRRLRSKRSSDGGDEDVLAEMKGGVSEFSASLRNIIDGSDDAQTTEQPAPGVGMNKEVSIHEAISKRVPTSSESELSAIPLPRGGVYVKTAAGSIQFGIPPETIKDSLNLGLAVPHFYVVPHERFNLDLGINVAEMEFPAYYNFFILKKSVNLIVTAEQERDLRIAFKETIEGPADQHLMQDEEYGKFVDPKIYEARPDLRKEIDFFCEPRGGRVISCDTLVQWTQFDDHGVARLEHEAEDGSIVVIEIVDDKVAKQYTVLENGKEVVTVTHAQACFVPSPENINGLYTDNETKDIQVANSNLDLAQQFRIRTMMNIPNPFVPPAFGVTMLGTSHGFDQAGTTTGFIIWMYGFGVAVDPPPHCDTYLMINGVSPRLINAVILTHCHADHDAGTFQKVLKERRITLITTKTIYKHFIRKYSAVSGLKAEFLDRLLDFQPVNIHEPFNLHGAQFNFFYALHALPCIGFKVTCGKKSLSYSADTLNELKSLNDLEQRGIISAQRKQSLLDFPWHCDLVLHECGVPPIHTPPETLQSQPPEVQKNLYAVHISDKAAEAAGLRRAKPGFSHTMVIHNAPRRNTLAIDTLQLCAATDIFRDADIVQCVSVLQMASRKRFRKGSIFDGAIGGVFFIVSEGALQIEREGKPPMLMELGDYFGEISAMTGYKERMKLTALTNVEVIDLDQFAFNQFLVSCPTALQRLKTLDSMRSQGFANSLRVNSVFRNITFPQRTQLQSLAVQNRDVVRGEKLFSYNECATSLVIICKGQFAVRGPGVDTNPQAESSNEASCASQGKDALALANLNQSIGQGGMFIPANVYNEVVLGATAQVQSTNHRGLSLVCKSDGVVFEISATGFAGFLERNPGIQLALMKHTTGVVL